MFRLLVASLVLGAFAVSLSNAARANDKSGPLAFTVKSLDGKDVDLSQYRGKVVLIVNVASHCGLTPQYAQLEELYHNTPRTAW